MIKIFVCGGCDKISTFKSIKKQNYKELKTDDNFTEIIYKCNTCKCVNHTYIKTNELEVIKNDL